MLIYQATKGTDMKLFTDRVNRKDFANRIDAELLKKSQEYRVLGTLQFIFTEKFDKLSVSEAPDLQDADGNVGVEVTTAVSESDMKASSAFCSYKKAVDEKSKKRAERKISETSSEIVLYENGITAMRSSGGMNEECEYKKSVIKKVKKSNNYKRVVKHLYLAVVLPEIPSSEAESNYPRWTREIIRNREFEEVYVISERFCIKIDLLRGENSFFKISNDQNLAIRKIARMTAEGELDFSSEEWN